jgi:hypothetical protein
MACRFVECFNRGMRLGRWPFVCFSLCLCVSSIRAEMPRLTKPEYTVKAAFLYNFAKLVEWPTNAFPAADSPIVIGVLGKDPFGSILDETVADKVINSRKVMVKRFQEIDQVDNCQLLFISASETNRISNILARLKGRSVLTVGESERFVELGGMIEFKKQKGAVRFEISEATAKQASLKISSSLLALAEPAISQRPRECEQRY